MNAIRGTADEVMPFDIEQRFCAIEGAAHI